MRKNILLCLWFVFFISSLGRRSRGGCARHLPAELRRLACPIGPTLAKNKIELGLEGFFSAPSRPIPKISGGRGEAFLPQ
jgi:hypothetical protein